MKQTSFFIEYHEARIHYICYEGGPKKLFCFHGFGQQAASFERLAKRLSKDYTLYAFDLFYHGKSRWPNCETAFSKEFLNEMMEIFLLHTGITRFSLCGYSMGGRIALCLCEKFCSRIESLLLIAPDGIKTNFWYSMATYPYWMRTLFRFSIRRPKLYFFASTLLYQLKIVNKGVLRFARRQMDTRQKRRKVYCTWLVYRHIKPDLNKVSKLLNESKVRVKIFIGTYDKIITLKSTKPLTSRLEHYDFSTLEKGHNTLIDDVAGSDGKII